MLPFILGGIALAATGYGVKRYLEEDDDIDNSDIIFDGINEIKDRLHATLFKETEWLYRSINNLRTTMRQLFLNDIRGKKYLLDNEKNREKLDEFCQILTAAEECQYKLLGELETVFCKIDDVEKLSNDDIVKVMQMRELDDVMHEACLVALTLDGTNISKMANITFGRLLSVTERNIA